MNSPWKVIADIESDNSRLIKESIILNEANFGNTELFAGLRLAFDCMITFGIKQVPIREGADGPGLTWDAFNSAVQKLISRETTGHAARDLVQDIMDLATNDQWNGWYRRILIKDMRAGFSEGTVNRVVKKKHNHYSVPVFTCQLAHDSTNHESKVSGKKLIEVKLDGVRVLTIVYPDGRVDQFTRNGKELVNFPHIVKQISDVVKENPPPYALVLDGEIMSSSFQDLMTQVHRKSDVKADDAILNLFDFIPLVDFEAGFWNQTQQIRSQMVQAWVNKHSEEMPNVRVLAHELVDLNTDDGRARFRMINNSAIDGGYEGIMIKDPEAGYECKRSIAWLKLKPFIEVSLAVTGVEEGTGKNVGRLGALVCGGQDDGKYITVNVGSGFTDDNRIEFWNCRSELTGQIVEVRADAITQNQDGTYSLRFPRFKGFRGFVPGEKL